MKSKLTALSTILILLLLVSGAAMAYFQTGDNKTNNFKMGTIKVEVVEEGFVDQVGVVAQEYSKNVQVRSLGTKRTYVRVRLIPEWSYPSLPVSNVQLNLADNSDWVYSDGYYYFKYYLTTNQITSKLLESVTFTELGDEHVGKTFSLHVIAEGAQITHEAWKDIWGITALPFTAEQPWVPTP